MSKKAVQFSVILALFVFVATARNGLATPLLSGPASGSERTDGGATVGFNFTVGAQTLLVSHLGFWDKDTNGLLLEHPVGLWKADGTPLGNVTVLAADALTGQFRYHALTSPIPLDIGATYVIGAFVPGILNTSDPGNDPWKNGGAVTFSADVNTLGPRYNISNPGALTFPEQTNGTPVAYTGPNLLYTIIPEPTSFVLIGMGGIAFSRTVRRRGA